MKNSHRGRKEQKTIVFCSLKKIQSQYTGGWREKSTQKKNLRYLLQIKATFFFYYQKNKRKGNYHLWVIC